MSAFIVMIVIIVIVVLIAKSVYDAQQARSNEATQPRPQQVGHHRPDRRPRPRDEPPVSVDEGALADHVAKLGEAVSEGLISMDEATASVVRFTDGQLSEEAAAELLRRQDAA